ncbi:hypothetical protein M514_14771 [Trichuris suis]|uniref:Uncharacterized protein n=1 Tax=Trichuris suis TaxID=68888 RepID=A0A085NTS1_9BILA|nr:hypothetical protein M514_14771 [Trichuris suis]
MLTSDFRNRLPHRSSQSARSKLTNQNREAQANLSLRNTGLTEGEGNLERKVMKMPQNQVDQAVYGLGSKSRKSKSRKVKIPKGRNPAWVKIPIGRNPE